MDSLTLIVFALFAAAVIGRLVEIAVKCPRAFVDIATDLRRFAEPTASAVGREADRARLVAVRTAERTPTDGTTRRAA